LWTARWVVSKQPSGERLPLLALRPVGASVGPFLDQGPIEPLDLAVGLGPVGVGAFVFDSLAGEQVPPDMGLVAGPVVGQYPLHRDPDRAEVGVGTLPEAGGGLFLLVGQQLALGQTGVVFHSVMDVGVSDFGAVLATLGSSQRSVPSSVRDVAELVDVHVHQLAGPLAFVASHHTAGGPVQVGQVGAPVAGQDVVDG